MCGPFPLAKQAPRPARTPCAVRLPRSLPFRPDRHALARGWPRASAAPSRARRVPLARHAQHTPPFSALATRTICDTPHAAGAAPQARLSSPSVAVGRGSDRRAVLGEFRHESCAFFASVGQPLELRCHPHCAMHNCTWISHLTLRETRNDAAHPPRGAPKCSWQKKETCV